MRELMAFSHVRQQGDDLTRELESGGAPIRDVRSRDLAHRSTIAAVSLASLRASPANQLEAMGRGQNRAACQSSVCLCQHEAIWCRSQRIGWRGGTVVAMFQ